MGKAMSTFLVTGLCVGLALSIHTPARAMDRLSPAEMGLTTGQTITGAQYCWKGYCAEGADCPLPDRNKNYIPILLPLECMGPGMKHCDESGGGSTYCRQVNVYVNGTACMVYLATTYDTYRPYTCLES